jgi:hypothetical protein
MNLQGLFRKYAKKPLYKTPEGFGTQRDLASKKEASKDQGPTWSKWTTRGAHPNPSGLVVGPTAPLCQMGPAPGMFLHRLLGSI